MTRAGWIAVAAGHAAAALALAIALSLFLTPEGSALPLPQIGRYAVYASALFVAALAAGTVVGGLLVGPSWWPVVYLWLVPFAIVALPAIDPSAAYFVYTGVTNRFAAGLAAVASALWVAGVAIGATTVVRVGDRAGARR